MATTDRKIIYQHPLFTSCNDVAAICQPLKQHFNLDFFLYQRDVINLVAKTQDQCAFLSNNAELLDFALLNYKDTESTVYPNKSRFQMLATYKPKLQTAIQKNCKIDGVISNKIRLTNNEWESFSFGSSTADPKTIEFCLNNLELLDKFIQYFRDRGKKLLDKIWQKRFTVDHQQNPIVDVIEECDNAQVESARDAFLQEIIPKHFYLLNNKNERVSIPKAEMQCLVLMAKGYPVKSIANVLGISARTVETNLLRSKNRLNCFTRKELLDVLELNNARSWIF